MRVLLRVAATLLIAIPLLLAFVLVFTLAGRRRASPQLERDESSSFGRGALAGPSLRGEVIAGLSR
jgi:hypothetical protein